MLGPHTVHLAVHPSAWTAAPPHTAERDSNPAPVLPTLTREGPNASIISPLISDPTTAFAGFTYPQVQLPHTYIHHLHTNALRVVAGDTPRQWSSPVAMEAARSLAKEAVTRAGFGWASELDTELPQPDKGPAARYSMVTVGYVVSLLPLDGY